MARLARFYGFTHSEMLRMPYSLVIDYSTEIDVLQLEEALLTLTIANDPKPTFQIDPKRNKLGALRENLKKLLDSFDSSALHEKQPDLEGLQMLKRKMAQSRTMRKRF